MIGKSPAPVHSTALLVDNFETDRASGDTCSRELDFAPSTLQVGTSRDGEPTSFPLRSPTSPSSQEASSEQS
jgi:hypothetical protein